MVWLSNKQMAIVAAHFGHRDLAAVPTGTGFVATCSCGYRSTRRRTPALAADAAAHHVRKVVRAAQNAGVSLRGVNAALPLEGKGANAPAAAHHAA